MNRGLSPWVSEPGTLRSTKKFLRTVKDAVVWPARVSAPVTPRAVMRYSDKADGALNVTRALPSLPVTTQRVPVGGLDEPLAGSSCAGFSPARRRRQKAPVRRASGPQPLASSPGSVRCCRFGRRLPILVSDSSRLADRLAARRPAAPQSACLVRHRPLAADSMPAGHGLRRARGARPEQRTATRSIAGVAWLLGLLHDRRLDRPHWPARRPSVPASSTTAWATAVVAGA